MNFRHGSEPAVSLVYSDKSSTGAKISLGLGDEVSRELRENSIRNSPQGNSEDQNLVVFEVCHAVLLEMGWNCRGHVVAVDMNVASL
jgi:hypothetical protein